MTDLRSLPRDRIIAAMALSENRASLPALQEALGRASGLQGHQGSPEGEKERQKGSSRGRRMPWTPQEDAALLSLVETSSHEEIGKILSRPKSGVRNRAHRLSALKRDMWTDEEVELLRVMYLRRAGQPLVLQEIADRLGKPRTGISRKARELGLTDNSRPASEAARAAFSKASKARIQAHGHPRGALGLKHTPESRALMGAASKAAAARTPKAERKRRARAAVATRVSKYGCGSPSMRGENAYSRARRGKRADLSNRYFRSAWEANYARYLNLLQSQGKIHSWEYEPDTFVFHGVTRGVLTYTPDFKVWCSLGQHVYHEVKGWMDVKSKAKLRRMSKHYPHETVIVIGSREYNKLKAKVAGFIPNWE